MELTLGNDNLEAKRGKFFMTSSFMGLEIGKRSILTHQTALNVTGHNLSNASTPGYSRQIAGMQTNNPWCTPSLTGSGKVGQFGTGVIISDVSRVREQFLDDQIRHENKTSGYWNAQKEGLDRIEVILNEPSEDGLRAVMDMFWESWQDLASNPESEAVRSVVAQRGMTLADTFNHTYRQLNDLKEDVNASIGIKTDEVNSVALQLTDLNQQIKAISISGQKPNDLLDKRDLLLDQLSNLVDCNIHIDANDLVTVQVGGHSLVQGIDNAKLATRPDSEGMYMINWEDTGTRANIDGGELGGLLDLRGKTKLSEENTPSEYKEIIPNLIKELNTLAKTIAVKTNELQNKGYSLNNKSVIPDGTDFFRMPTASIDNMENWAEYMQVSAIISDDPKNIAAAGEPTWDADGHKANFGDGSNALVISQLKHNLNSEQISIKTGNIAFTNGQQDISFNIEYGKEVINILISNSASSVDERAELINNAVAAKLGNSIITVEADGENIVFSSSNNNFKGIKKLNINNVSQGDFQALMVKDVTSDDFWRSASANIGVQSQEAKRMVNNQEILMNQLENKRQSQSGVSQDEEMTNIIKLQHGYNAAARLITTIDEEIDTIINRMGLVGR